MLTELRFDPCNFLSGQIIRKGEKNGETTVKITRLGHDCMWKLFFTFVPASTGYQIGGVYCIITDQIQIRYKSLIKSAKVTLVKKALKCFCCWHG